MTEKDKAKIAAWCTAALVSMGCGLFVSRTCKHLNQGAPIIQKVGNWLAAGCAAFTMGCTLDTALSDTWKEIDELYPDEEEGESTGTYFEEDHGDSGL